MINLTDSVFGRFWSRFIDYLPDFFGGLLILIIGILAAGILKRLLLTILRFFKVDAILDRTKLLPRNEVNIWEEILAEVLRWTVIILFLIPTLEAWRLSKATEVLNQLLFYLPNVIVSVIIAFIGLVLANLGSRLVTQSTRSLGTAVSNTLAALARSVIIFFTILVVLNQLGVAQDLIRILFTGIIAMLALAGGLAFGLGGKDLAGEILNTLKGKLK
jgi:hypothetical protein